MIDPAGLRSLGDTLAADGYAVAAEERDGRVRVRITVADPSACADCLAPEEIMRPIVADLLSIPPSTVDLTYPTTIP